MTRRRSLELLLLSAWRASGQGESTRNVIPTPRGKPSGLPFHARFTDVAKEAGLREPVIWGVDDHKTFILEATGCGDAVAALFLGWLLKGKPVPDALAATIAAIYGVIEETMRSGGGELALVAAQEELVSPSRTVSVRRL